MKKLLLIMPCLFWSITNIYANKNYTVWVTTTCNGGPSGYSSVRTGTGTVGMQDGANWIWCKANIMNCNNPGSNCCSWDIIDPTGNLPGTLDADQSYANACTQISNGNTYGQIYSDGSRGNATITNIVTDGSELPCYIWGVSQGENNYSQTTVMVLDYGTDGN
jgi:hypothetical protein